jgi:hypothetical protein
VASFALFFLETVAVQVTRLSNPRTAPYLFTLQEVMRGGRPTTLVIAGLLTLVSAAFLTAALLYTEQRDF